MICLIQLQAAMAFGILLYAMILILFLVLLPILFILFFYKDWKLKSESDKKLSVKAYLKCVLIALLKAFFAVTAITVSLLVLIFLVMRNVVFM